MCGISGIIGTNVDKNGQKIKTMTDALMHRGPDGEGYWSNQEGTVHFGHRRLSIIDLSERGAQPMTYKGRYTITYNGEIYNYLEIKNDLISKGHNFYSTTDTEVVLAAYDEFGLDCLSLFDGMFAFAIWDNQTKTVFIARDRFGEKPLFYTSINNSFVFASEIKSLWAWGVEKKVNLRMLYNYIYFDTFFNPDDCGETFYSNIRQLEHSHYLLLNEKGVIVAKSKYWDIDYDKINPTPKISDAVEQFKFLLAQSVKRRMRSDVPIGSSLSGGLDSSSIVCLIDYLNNNRTKQFTFSARFPGYKKDESVHIEKVLNKINPLSYSCYPDENSINSNIDKIIYHQDEPFGTLSIAAQFEVMKLAKEHNVLVMLDGQGADEYLCGYPGLIDSYFSELKAKNKILYSEQKNKMREIQKSNSINSVLRREFRGSLKNILSPQFIDQASILFKKINPVFSSQFDSFNIPNSDCVPYNRVYKSASLNEMLYYSLMKGGLQELLRYADRNSMANSIEVRLPFLSSELIEYVFSLPPDMKYKDGYTKYILRLSMSEYLPDDICWRKDKIGYQAPQNHVKGVLTKKYILNTILHK